MRRGDNSVVVRGPPNKPKRYNLTQDQIEELKEAFDLFDTNRSGDIDSREFKAALRALGFEVSKEDVRIMFKELDKEFQETISFNEFCSLMIGRMPAKDSREEISKMFILFDEDNTGKISFQNLKNISHELEENLEDGELTEMIDEADRDGDGLIDFEEFYKIMRPWDDPLDGPDD
eukprot:Selendium_serpulae@DN6227_c0_g1_i5.p1